MCPELLPYETDLFFLIHDARSTFADGVMQLYSGRMVWILPACFIVAFVIYKKNWKEWIPILVAIILLFILCDKISAGIIKPYFARPRPAQYPGIMEQLGFFEQYARKSYGFISAHTTNAFGFAMFSSLLFRYRPYSVLIFIWALIMSYSRIYLGVHFVSDVLGGMIVGMLIGDLVYLLYRVLMKKLSGRYQGFQMASFSHARVRILILGIAGYIILFSTLSPLLLCFLI